MKLKQVNITNFRGIKNAVIDIEDFTTLIGPNNIGKSTILRAIKLVLNNEKPSIDDWPFKQPSAEKMRIECIFDKLEDWEKTKPAISKLIYNDELRIKLEATWSSSEESLLHAFYAYYMEESTLDGNKLLNDRLNYTSASKDSVIKSVLIKLNISNATDYNQRITEVMDTLRSEHSDQIKVELSWFEVKFSNSLQQAVPHIMYVPATFKIEDELKTTANSSPFAFLFNNKLFPLIKSDSSYIEYEDKVGLLHQRLSSSNGTAQIDGLNDVMEKMSNSLNEILDFSSQVKLSFSKDSLNVDSLVVKAATFIVKEEIETNLAYQGSGVQRALAYAILETNAEIESSVSGGNNRSVIVLYEEPELYIHPHLMRRLKETLVNRSKDSRWQVICTTHSPFLIDIANNPKSLKLLQRDYSGNRVIHQVAEDIFVIDGEYNEKNILRAALDFHPTICESLFAKRVVIVEGDTEVAVFSLLEELCSKLNICVPHIKDTTIVSAGGKWTIPAITRVLNGLGIKYKIMHDMDKKGLSDTELDKKPSIHPYKANAKIQEIAGSTNVYVVEDTFEHLLWGPESAVSSKDKPYRSWSKINAFIKGEDELGTTSKEKLKEIISFLFK